MLLLSAKLIPAGDNLSLNTESNIANVLLVAGQIFLLSSLRMLPVTSPTCAILLQRLVDALDSEDLLKVWIAQCPIEALLWAITMGMLVASSGDASMGRLSGYMDETTQLLQVTNYEDLEYILKRYAWSDYCSINIERVWNKTSVARLGHVHSCAHGELF